jgi:hypothetical protein
MGLVVAEPCRTMSRALDVLIVDVFVDAECDGRTFDFFLGIIVP